MSSHKEADISRGFVDLKEYIERIFDEKQKALEIAFKAQQDALSLASRVLEIRLEKLNELRQEVTQDRANYITRDKAEADTKSLENRLSLLENFRGKALGFGALTALLSGAVGAAIARAIS